MQGNGKISSKLARHARGLLVGLVGAIALGGGLATPALASARPLQGIFDACDISTRLTTCEARLATIQAGGLKVVVQNLPGTGVTLQEITDYANYANGLGLSVMWELDEPALWEEPSTSTSLPGDLAEFDAGCGCNEVGPFTSYMISWLAALPNTYGFYAADDSAIDGSQDAELTSYVAEIKAADPGHMVMIGADPGQGTEFANTGATLGDELYPVFNSPVMPAAQNSDTWDWVTQSIESVQHSATSEHVASAYILQAFTFGDNLDDGEAVGVCTAAMSQQQCASLLLYPSAATQLQLRNEVLEHSSASLILWYNFAQTDGQSGDDTFDTYPTGANAAARWTGLQAAINAPYPGTQSSAAAKQAAAAKHAAAARRAAAKRAAARTAAARRAAAKRTAAARRAAAKRVAARRRAAARATAARASQHRSTRR